MEEETENWYSFLVPKCCKAINCFTCQLQLPDCIKNFWDKFKNSKWGELLKVIEEMDVTDGDWWNRVRQKIKNMNCSRREWWLGMLGMFLVLLPKSVKFIVLDVFFPGFDVYTDCDAADKHLK